MHPKQKIILILFVILFALLQSTVLNYVSFAGVKPDILLVIVIFTSFYTDWRFAFKIGLLAGLLKDILSGGIFGLDILIYGFCGLILGLYSKKIYREGPISGVVICFGVTLSLMCLYYVITNIFLPLPNFVESLKIVIFPTAIYTSLVFWVISSFLSKVINIIL